MREGDILFTATINSVFVWDVATGRCLRTLHTSKKHTYISEIRLDSSGALLFGSSTDGTVCAWNIQTGELLVKMHQLSAGFPWTTPPDEVSNSGWFWTDHPELITVSKAYDNGSEPEVPADHDPERLAYIADHNRQDIVMKRLNDYQVYDEEKNRLQRLANTGSGIRLLKRLEYRSYAGG